MFVGEFAEGAVTVLLFSVGELLESYSLDRARNAIRTLMELAPAEASRLYQGQEQRVSVAALRIGDHILVRPGERLPMDGRVLEGRSAINQAPITGESLPVERGVGDEVFAGTVNGNGALTVEVTHLAANTTLARIMRLVEEAQAQRAPAQRFVDRFARVYTPIVIGLAVGVATLPPLLGLAAFGNWFYRALVLLVIACPCALVISTPVTIVSALARAARSGVLIKGGRHLEQLASLRVIAFDKTGTLTRGEPYVVGGGCELHPESLQCSTCDDLVAKAAAIEGRSEHALARAVTQHAEAQGLRTRYAPGENVVTTTGMGIEGLVEGHNVTVGSLAFCRLPDGAPADALCAAVNEAERLGHTVLVIQDACCSTRCYLTVSDTLRSGVPQVLREVKRAGIKHTVMLTGDNAHIAAATGEKAGIDEVRAGLLPEDKVRAVEEMRMRYGQVAMVGDGVNDAPAMAKASLGIAMGAAGTDTALETADIALMGDDLSRLPFAIRLSRSTLNTVRANIVVALALKALFLALAVGGVATLWMAVLADTGASLLVSLNGLRMLAFRDGTRQRGPDSEQA
jgi:Cd2+/Zn2+-exporting ATPase